MQRSFVLSALLVGVLGLPACFTARRAADLDRTPAVDTGMGAAILMPGQTAPSLPQGGVAPGGTQQTRVGPEGHSGSTSGSAQPSTGPLTMIGSSKMDENRHEVGKEDPLIQKWALAPLGVLAAPFVWAAELARGEPESGPAVPSANKPGPKPAPPPSDYESQSLREMERELAERASAKPPPGSRSMSIADELAALQRAPRATPPLEPAPAPTPAPRSESAESEEAEADGIVDRDGDGRIDEWIYREHGQVVRRALDRNADGQVDTTLHYDPQTHELARVEEDDDRDGTADAWTVYRDGQVVRRRADADGDGEVDTWAFFANGRMTRHEQDTTGDGFRDRTGFYADNHLAREEYDRDGDGVADVINHYDADEQITRREEDVDRNGSIDRVSHYENGRLARKEILSDADDRASR
ncbi:MAG: hypothetical protein JRH16_02930 [Deltaproteobacteria bacterium]|nr:hypothetical protein [Deltaproteobacteria bacterium]